MENKEPRITASVNCVRSEVVRTENDEDILYRLLILLKKTEIKMWERMNVMQVYMVRTCRSSRQVFPCSCNLSLVQISLAHLSIWCRVFLEEVVRCPFNNFATTIQSSASIG
jgi:hypothetical protein